MGRLVSSSRKNMSILEDAVRAKAGVRGGLVLARDVDTANPLEFGGKRKTMGKL